MRPSRTNPLLVVCAAMELPLGLLLLIAPSATVELLLGAGLDSAESILIGRLGGAALLSIGTICWLERHHDRKAPANGVVAGLLVYNALAVALLVHAATVGKMTGIGIWPAAGLHAAVSLWGAARLRAAGSTTSNTN